MYRSAVLLKRSAILGRTALEVFPGTEPQWFERYGEVVKTGVPAHFQERFGPLDRWFEVSAYRTGPAQVATVFFDITEQKRAGEALRQNEEWLRAVVETTPACIKVVAADGTLVWMNSAGLAMVDADRPEDVQGGCVYGLVCAEYRDAFREFNERVCRGESGAMEFEIEGLRGTRRRMETHAAPLRGPDGSLRQLAVTHDITERKRAESLRAGQRHVLEMIARGAPLADVLGAVCRLIEGQEPGLLCSILLTDDSGQHTGSGVGPSLPEEFVRALEGIRIAPPHTGSCCMALDCGQEVLVADIENDRRWSPLWRDLNLSHGLRACRSIPIFGSGGTVLASVAVFRRQPGDPGPADEQLLGIATHLAGIAIERRRAEEATHRRSEQLRQLAEVATRLNAALDVASVTGVVTEEARSLVGAHLAVTAFTTDQDWARAVITVSVSEKYARWRGNGEMRDGSGIDLLVCRTNRPLRLTQADLERHPASERAGSRAADRPPLRGCLAAPLVGRDGRNFGLVRLSDKYQGEFTAEDEAILVQLAQMASVAIENARLVQDLRDTDRRKDEFLATLAHELRNPLAPLRNAVQILKMPRVDAATVERSRDMMDRQVQHLVRLVDDLLDVSRVMRGKIVLRKGPVELASAVARAVETAQPLVEAQRHELTLSLPSESLLLEADPVRLAQVVGNLLTNAAKYTEPGGRIWLTARREGDQAVLRLRDSGIGIAPEMLPHVFDLFVQVDHAASRSQGGLGIGLTLVKNLVEMHGGRVEAQSAGLGRGSEFVVRLPLSAQEPPRDPQAGRQVPESPSPSGHRLLVVDDNQDAADSLAMLLRLQGHDVRVAFSGVAALEMTKTYTPDVVFLDIGMPGMDGYEVARRLRQQPGLEKVMLTALTGWGQQEDRRRTAEAGFDHHLVKPPDPQALESVLAGLKTAAD